MRNISKQAWTEAKAAGLTTLTFAAWRAEQKTAAAEAGEQTTTFDTTGAAVETLDQSQLGGPGTIDNAISGAEFDTAMVDEAELVNGAGEVDTGAAAGAVIDESDASNANSAAGVVGAIDIALTNVLSERVRLAVENKQSKSLIAQAIFADALDKQTATGVPMVRKDVIALFVAVANLSKPGANTYYQNIREKNGLVTKKA